MMKIVTPILIALLLTVVAVPSSQAVITMTIDRAMVDFRIMENGQSTEVSDQGVYDNQVTCTSTNNVTWYLKTNLVRPFTSGPNTIPNENFSWKVVNVVNGRGMVFNNLNAANSFTDARSLVYTSDPADNTGAEVRIQFRYLLTIPKNQIAGNYFATVRWTMNETL
jgi:hypothetical protein